jgi:HAD superfamily hydrolase (TIGR01484 family)
MSPKSKVPATKSTSPIQLISTDFDGTLFAEFENPPVPRKLQEIIAELQGQGAKWVINTGRDLSGLMEAMGRSHLTVKPDFLVLVEREIYVHEDSQYVALAEWNDVCHRTHAELFARVRRDVPELIAWVNARFAATIYEDIYSPFCFIAEKTADAEAIHEYLDGYCKRVPELVVVRNDVYARFSHVAFNKGTALNELARRLKLKPENILAAGDHLNDVPMLSKEVAHYLVTNSNAIPLVKQLVRDQNGFISEKHCGHGIAEGLEYFVRNGKS